jgi:hypothetical protein
MDDGYIISGVSNEIDSIIRNLRKRDWLLSNHQGEADLYSFPSYMYNHLVEKIDYFILLDRNILIYILSGYKEGNPSAEYRDAVGLVAFCQFLEIHFNISLAIHERVKNKIDIQTAAEEIDLFFKIYDSDPKELCDFALGIKDSFTISQNDVSHLKQKLFKWYEDYEFLTEWKSIYLITLKIAQIYACKKKEGSAGFTELIDWMQKYYRYSLVCIVFAIFLFSSNKIKGQMKFKSPQSWQKRKSQIVNMTWDLYVMNFYFRKLQKKTDNEEFIVASNDIALRKILKVALDVQNNSSTFEIKKYLNSSDHKMVDYLERTYNPNDSSRAFDSSISGFQQKNYRQELIETLEKELFSEV